jgi:DNA repair ATPase RecN
MLKRIRIKNFQKHDKLDIEFSPNVTTIVGSSDSGKSAIVRALRWACLNKPNGSSFIRNGQKSVKVRIEVDDSKITRTKGSSNTYELDEEKFHSFGTSVPDDIKNLLKLDDINFQCQHDSPFWFSDSPGQVSKNLNQIIDLSIIDRTLSEAASLVRKSKADVDASERSLSASQEQLDNLNWVEQASKEFKDIEQLTNDIESNNNKIQDIQELISQIFEANKKSNIKEQFENDLNDITILAQSMNDTKIDDLSEIILECKELKIEIQSCNARLEVLQSEFDEIELCPTCQRPL